LKLRTAHRWGKIEALKIKYFLTGVKDVATTIALTAKKDTIVVPKSTVPDSTNGRLRKIIDRNKLYHILNKINSNLRFIVITKSKKVSQFQLSKIHLEVGESS